MTRDSARSPNRGPEPRRQEEPYTGPLGRTRLETVHWTLSAGEIGSVRVHTVVNATTDPGVAERLLSGDLNWVQPAGSAELQQVTVPVIYHDEARALFVLVLPEAFRGRELEERAELLRRLSAEGGQPVPRYVLGFHVAYGEVGLHALLAQPQPGLGGASDADLAQREEQIVAREAKLAEWEARLDGEEQRLALDVEQRRLLDGDVSSALQAELRRREQDLARREAELREVERLVLDRQAELDRMEKRLRHEPLPPRSDGDSPTRVAHQESLELAAREVAEAETEEGFLEEAVAPEPPGAAGTLQDEALPEEPGAPSEAWEDPWAGEAEGGTSESTPFGVPPPRKRTRETVTTPLAEAVLAAAAASASLDREALAGALDAPLSDEEVAPSREPVDEDAPLTEEAAGEAAPDPEVPALPEALVDWYDDASRPPRWYLSEQGVHLAVCLPTEQAEAFVGMEPQGLLQLHRFESFAWITITVVSSSDQEDPASACWPLDVRNDRDLGLLDRLADDFRFALEIYDELLEPVTTQELHYPLEENVRIVCERAQESIGALSPQRLDPVAAWEVFCSEGYQRLEAGRLEFGPNDFQQLQSAAEVAAAVEVVARFSAPEAEDALILGRSFPAASWRALRLRVLRQAVEYGIWLDADLRRLALDAGFATSRRDLLRASLAGFEWVATGELASGLSAQQEHANWSALREEAERLGVPLEPRWEELAEQALARATGAEVEARIAAAEASGYTDQLERLDEADLLEAAELEEGEPAAPEHAEAPEAVDASDLVLDENAGQHAPRPVPLESLEELSPAELVVMLGEAETRLPAALELCRRREARALPELFGLLPGLGRTEVVRLAPHLVGFGRAAEPWFADTLRSPSSLLRVTSALALGALQSSDVLDALIDLLLDEPTEQWRFVATALGDLGRDAVMSLASRIRHSSDEQKQRLAAALAEISQRGGARDLLVDLSSSRDAEAAEVANRALALAAELQLEREDQEPLPAPDQPVALFTRRFLYTLSRDERELAEDDILEAEDIVEEGDVLDEEPLRP